MVARKRKNDHLANDYLVGTIKKKDFVGINKINSETRKKLLSNTMVTYTIVDPSMLPYLRLGSMVHLHPRAIADINVGDVVFCKFHTSYYLNFVTAVNRTQGKVRISSAFEQAVGSGKGWTSEVFGVVVEYIEVPMNAEDY